MALLFLLERSSARFCIFSWDLNYSYSGVSRKAELLDIAITSFLGMADLDTAITSLILRNIL